MRYYIIAQAMADYVIPGINHVHSIRSMAELSALVRFILAQRLVISFLSVYLALTLGSQLFLFLTALPHRLHCQYTDWVAQYTVCPHYSNRPTLPGQLHQYSKSIMVQRLFRNSSRYSVKCTGNVLSSRLNAACGGCQSSVCVPHCQGHMSGLFLRTNLMNKHHHASRHMYTHLPGSKQQHVPAWNSLGWLAASWASGILYVKQYLLPRMREIQRPYSSLPM